MKIICTVPEFAKIVRGCHDAIRNGYCSKCVLFNICEDYYPGNIEQFVTAADIVDEQEDEDK